MRGRRQRAACRCHCHHPHDHASGSAPPTTSLTPPRQRACRPPSTPSSARDSPGWQPHTTCWCASACASPCAPMLKRPPWLPRTPGLQPWARRAPLILLAAAPDGHGLCHGPHRRHSTRHTQDAAPAGPVEVTVFDAAGIGAGGSGAAAGLLHALTPKGKVGPGHCAGLLMPARGGGGQPAAACLGWQRPHDMRPRQAARARRGSLACPTSHLSSPSPHRAARHRPPCALLQLLWGADEAMREAAHLLAAAEGAAAGAGAQPTPQGSAWPAVGCCAGLIDSLPLGEGL